MPKVNPSVNVTGPPEWTRNLIFKEELNGGFTDLSDGFSAVTKYHIVRERKGATVTDGARWSTGMTAGKHVFQVYWPDEGNRGTCSCVGVGSADVLLKQPGRVSLVGDHSLSWGLDLTKRRSIHFKKMEQRLHARVPEIFYMYVDLDGGNIGFGDDVVLHQKSAEFYGQILTNIPKNSSRPLYVMVSSCNPGEQIHVYYRGTAVPSGGFDLCYPIQPMEFQQFQHKQQQQQQIPYIGFNPAPMAPVASMAPMATMAPLTPPPPYEESIVPGPPIYFDPVIAKEEKIPRKKF